MKQKLTLSLDRSIIERVKAYAETRGKSVSQLASEYFDMLTREEAQARHTGGRPGRDYPLPEAVQELVGIAVGTEEDYLRHLEEKHR